MNRGRTFDRAAVGVASASRSIAAEPQDATFERSSLGAKLARGSGAAFVVHVTGVGLTYCVQVAVARMIGTEGFGVYAYVLAWVTMLAYVSALGFDICLLRFVPAYLARRAFTLLRGVVEYSGRRAVTAGCAITFAGIAVILIRSKQLAPSLVSTFLVGFPLVPILALLRIRAAAVRGFGGVIWALAPDRLVRDGVLFVLLAGMAALWRVDAPWAMVATVLGTIAGLGLVSLAMRLLSPAAMNAFAPSHERGVWRRTAAPLMVVAVIEALMNRVGVLLLGVMVGTRDAGIYAAAFNIAFVVVLPQAAVNTLLAPIFSDLFVRNDRAGLQATVAKASMWTLLGAGGIALPILIFAEPALSLFGRDFVAGTPALRILLVGQMVAAAAGSQLQLMNMTGHERSAAILLLAGAATNAAMTLALVGSLGATGAALAATMALLGWNVAMALSIRRHLQMLPGVLAAWPDKARSSLRCTNVNAG